jgi:hypothetical protein
VERCAERLPALDVSYFVEHDAANDPPEGKGSRRSTSGRISVEAVWPRIGRPFEATYYISGPPPMLRTIRQDLGVRHISPEAIRIDAWA